MNGSLLAIVGGLVLLGLILIVILIMKMRVGKSKPDAPSAALEEASRDVPREQPSPARKQDETVPEPLMAAEQELVAEPIVPMVAVQESGEAEEAVVEPAAPEQVREEESPQTDGAPPSVAVGEQYVEPAVEEIDFAEKTEDPESQTPPEPLVESIPLVTEAEETVTGAVEAEAEAPIDEEVAVELPKEPSAETADALRVISNLEPSAKTVEATLLLVRMSMEEYGERLNRLEEKQRVALAEAIASNDEQRRDQLQRELVLMNDRLALLADHYVEEMAIYQQVLDTLARLQAQEPSSGLVQAIEELQKGQIAAAALFLDELSEQPHPLAVQASFLRGQLAECQVDLQKAMACYRRALAAMPNTAQYLRATGLMARNLYLYQEALGLLESYVQCIRESHGSDAKALALAQRELAYTYVLSGQYQKAGPLYKESMTVLAQKLGQDHPEMAISWQQIGEFQETMGEYDKAVGLYKKALAILEKKRGPEHPALAGILRKLAALCIELELEPEALPLYERLVRIQEKALLPTHPQLAISLNSLAEAYRLQGRYAEAEACYLKTLRMNEQLHGAEHPSVAAILQELAKVCTSQRRREEAAEYQQRAAAIFQKSVEAAEKKAGEEALTLELS
jgi:tetratricopeptide (TPR) repeat protein